MDYRRAQRLLETTKLAVERVAAAAGFGSATVMRKHVGEIVGTTPRTYRRAFGFVLSRVKTPSRSASLRSFCGGKLAQYARVGVTVSAPSPPLTDPSVRD